jgi:hypothetical protein
MSLMQAARLHEVGKPFNWTRLRCPKPDPYPSKVPPAATDAGYRIVPVEHARSASSPEARRATLESLGRPEEVTIVGVVSQARDNQGLLAGISTKRP